MADKNKTAVAKSFQFELVSPECVLSSEQATMVVIPGEEGEFGVMAGHIPLVSSLKPGIVQIHAPDGSKKKIFVAGGFADVGMDVCSVLAEEAVPLEDLNRAALEASLKDLEDDLGYTSEDPAKKLRIEREIETTKAKLSFIA